MLSRWRHAWGRALVVTLGVLVLAATVVGVAVNSAVRNLDSNIRTLDISDIAGTPTPTPTPRATRDVNDSSPEPSIEKAAAPPINILLMGSDSRQGDVNSQFGDPNVHSTERSDTTLLLHIAGNRKWATAISFPRDTWTYLPQCPSRYNSTLTQGGYEGKFNHAFQYGGPGCTVKLVQDLTGIPVDHFIVIDFEGFQNVVDALGGVPMTFSEPLYDASSGLDIPAGEITLTGEQSLSFVRARKALSDGSDISRIARQHEFLLAASQAADTKGLLTDPLKLYQVLDVATQSVVTDPELGSVEALLQLARELEAISPERISFLTVPWYPRGDGENVLVNEAEADLVWERLKRDRRPLPVN